MIGRIVLLWYVFLIHTYHTCRMADLAIRLAIASMI